MRWCIEKFFKTSKKSLGLEDCQSQKLEEIKSHIFAVMFSYATLEEIKIFKRKKFPEHILGILKSKISGSLSLKYADLVETYAIF